MKVVLYWLARTGIFLVCIFVLWLIDWFDVIAVIAAFVLAWLISYLVLPGMRRDAQLQMDQVLDRSRRKIQQSHAEEDAELGEHDGGGAAAPQPSDPDAERE